MSIRKWSSALFAGVLLLLSGCKGAQKVKQENKEELGAGSTSTRGSSGSHEQTGAVPVSAEGVINYVQQFSLDKTALLFMVVWLSHRREMVRLKNP